MRIETEKDFKRIGLKVGLKNTELYAKFMFIWFKNYYPFEYHATEWANRFKGDPRKYMDEYGLRLYRTLKKSHNHYCQNINKEDILKFLEIEIGVLK